MYGMWKETRWIFLHTIINNNNNNNYDYNNNNNNHNNNNDARCYRADNFNSLSYSNRLLLLVRS